MRIGQIAPAGAGSTMNRPEVAVKRDTPPEPQERAAAADRVELSAAVRSLGSAKEQPELRLSFNELQKMVAREPAEAEKARAETARQQAAMAERARGADSAQQTVARLERTVDAEKQVREPERTAPAVPTVKPATPDADSQRRS